MKKSFLKVLGLSFLVLTLGACGSSSKSNEGVEDKKADKGLEVLGDKVSFDPNKLINDGKPIDLEYWTWGDNDPVISMAKEYEKIYPNVTIKTVVQPWDDMWKKIPLSLKGKDGPSVFNIHNSQHSILFPYMAPYDIATEDLQADFTNVDSHIIDGKVYYIDTAVNTGNIYYNKALWKEAGLTENDIPKTWNDFREVAKKLTKTENDKIVQAGFNYNGAGGYNAMILGLNYQKGELLFKDDKTTVNFDNEATRENTKFLIDLYEKDKVGSKDFGDDATMSFGNGQSAMVYRWGWMAGELDNKYPDIDYGIFPTPTPSEETPFAYDRYNGESSPGVNKNQTPERQAVAQDFIRYVLANDEYSKKMAVTNASFPTKKSLATDEDILSHPVLKEIGPRMDRLIWPGAFPSTIETTGEQVIQNIIFNDQDLNKAITDGQTGMEKDMKGSDFVSLEDTYQFFKEAK